MSIPDLHERLAALANLAGDAATVKPAAEIRARGARRSARRTALAGIGAVVVLGIAALGLVQLRPTGDVTAAGPPHRNPTAGNHPTPDAAARSATDVPSPTGQVPDAGSTVTMCRAADLTLSPIQRTGAMGRIGYDITVTNSGGRMCTLPAGYPVLVYADTTGAGKILPTKTGRDKPPAVQLPPGGIATMTLITVNGYGGYDPSSPACAHPVTYRELAVLLGDGQRLSLTGLVLPVRCGEIELRPWTAG